MPIEPMQNHSSIEPDNRLSKVLEAEDERVSSWRIFKIIGELVDGYEFLKNYQLAASIFGSARFTNDSEYYQQAAKLGRLLSQSGFAVITGGGPGIMEAANKGAFDAGGRSVGINIQLPHEQRINEYVTESTSFNYFFVRKLMLSFASEVYIFFPGGFGTLDEFFELLTLIQTKKSKPLPVIMVGRDFWEPLMSWIKSTVFKQLNAIDKEDIGICHLVNDADEAFSYIKDRLNIIKNPSDNQ